VACGLFLSEQRPVVAQRIDVEELERSPDRVEGPLGDAQIIADVKDVDFNADFHGRENNQSSYIRRG
jgi:hypothetical protein